MKRFIVLLVAATVVGLLSSVANATPANTTRLTISCDRGSTATAVVTLQGAQSSPLIAPSVTLTCDATAGARSMREVDVTGFAAGWAAVNPFSVGAQLCSAAGTLPLKFNCADASGANATVVAR
jgi:hypothetical protein